MSKPDNYAEVLKLAVHFLQDDTDDDKSHEFIPDYSGRNMHGATTPAIVSDAHPMLVAVAIAKAVRYCSDASYSADKIISLMENYLPYRTDSMGKYSYVYY